MMQTGGFEYLKESCPSVLSDLLEYVAATEHSVCSSWFGYGIAPNGSDVNRRRVKQRVISKLSVPRLESIGRGEWACLGEEIRQQSTMAKLIARVGDFSFLKPTTRDNGETGEVEGGGDGAGRRWERRDGGVLGGRERVRFNLVSGND
ncbi:hypothetical protein Drorol1_Dr00024709 [Drosera rotundifolia]